MAVRGLRFAGLLLLAASLSATVSCHHVDDDRIPSAPVNLVFRGQQMWDVYGVHGATEYRRFIKSERLPADFFYVAGDYTGFGGLLLCGDFFGNPVVYDLACPVECRGDVRVNVDNTSNIAVCPVCHSTYAIYENYGHPLSGIAAERGYGLKRYRIGQAAGADYVITR